MKKLFVLIFFIPTLVFSQQKGDNTIKVTGVTFIQVCKSLLDSGYFIEKKDEQLGTIRTEFKEYPAKFNGAFFIDVRIIDSVALIKGKFSAPWSRSILVPNIDKTNPLFDKEEVVYTCNAKGKATITLQSYPFSFLDKFAHSFNKPVEYLKQ